MPEIDINDLTSIGVVNDVPAYQLPPEAWTTGLNIRYRDRGVESLLGWEPIFGTPPFGHSPHFIMSMSTPDQQFWLWASANDIFVFDGSTHTSCGRAGGYTPITDTWRWNGTIFGGIPIFNNGVDVPQSRPNMALGTLFQNMPNWPGTLRAKVVRSMAPYLMAFHLTDSTSGLPVLLPHTIQWSHPADPGSLPSSWDYTDPTKDAGRKDLDDVQSGLIMDALPLRSQMYIYKENSVWRATPIGGKFIFDFKTVFETSGILTHRCVALTGDGLRHCVVTQDDMVWHNGQRMVSILDDRQRTRLFAEMHQVNYINSFMFCNPLMSEIWFCYPTSEAEQPNKALIWNYKEGGEKGTVSYADGITFRNADSGNIQGGSVEIWDEGVDTWDEDTGPWSEFSRRRVVMTSVDKSKFYNLDRSSTRDGLAYHVMLQREGLSIVGRKRNGEWIVDFHQKKMFQRLWPKIQGGPVDIRVGVQQVVNGPIMWGAKLEYSPSVARTCDIDPVEGAALAIEFSSENAVSWRLDGYKMELALLGSF